MKIASITKLKKVQQMLSLVSPESEGDAKFQHFLLDQIQYWIDSKQTNANKNLKV